MDTNQNTGTSVPVQTSLVPIEEPDAKNATPKPKRPIPDFSWRGMASSAKPERWAALSDLEDLDPKADQEHASGVLATACRTLSGREFAEVMKFVSKKLGDGLETGRFRPGEDIPD